MKPLQFDRDNKRRDSIDESRGYLCKSASAGKLRNSNTSPAFSSQELLMSTVFVTIYAWLMINLAIVALVYFKPLGAPLRRRRHGRLAFAPAKRRSF